MRRIWMPARACQSLFSLPSTTWPSTDSDTIGPKLRAKPGSSLVSAKNHPPNHHAFQPHIYLEIIVINTIGITTCGTCNLLLANLRSLNNGQFQSAKVLAMPWQLACQQATSLTISSTRSPVYRPPITLSQVRHGQNFWLLKIALLLRTGELSFVSQVDKGGTPSPG